MTNNDEYDLQIKHTFLQICILAVFLVACACFLGRGAAVPGLLWGITASMVNFSMMAYRIKRCADMSPDKAISYIRRGGLVRFGFILLALVLALKIRQIEFPAAAIGLLSLQMVIVINAVVAVSKSLFKRRLS